MSDAPYNVHRDELGIIHVEMHRPVGPAIVESMARDVIATMKHAHETLILEFKGYQIWHAENGRVWVDALRPVVEHLALVVVVGLTNPTAAMYIQANVIERPYPLSIARDLPSAVQACVLAQQSSMARCSKRSKLAG